MTDSPSAIDLRRLWWVGPLTILAAIVAVLALQVLAFALLDLSREFVPLAWGALVIFTAVLVGAAVLVFAVVARLAKRPILMYRRIALGTLILSMIPDFLLPGGSPGATWPAVLVLMATHIAAWWPTVTILTRWTLRPNAGPTSI